MSILQIVLLLLMFQTVAFHLAFHGKETTPVNLYVCSASWLFEIYVLNSVNFFSSINWVQIVYILISLFGLVNVLRIHGKTTIYSGPLAIVSFVVMITLYYLGGFFN